MGVTNSLQQSAGGGRITFVMALMYAAMGFFPILFPAWEYYQRTVDIFDTKFDGAGEYFDFIVVGAGSAGSVVANRLSVNHSVLLLEAGGELNVLQNIPLLAYFLMNYPELDWMHKTVPQKYAAFASNNQQPVFNQGRNLGGTSSINFMIQSRGNPKDFDNWAEITGDPSWSYEEVLPFFKKHENFIGKYSSDDTHGQGGDVTIQIPPYVGIAEYYIKAGEELGYPRMDLNGRFTQGFDFIYSPIKRGRRDGAYWSFIMPARNRRNLTIRKFSHVNKILLRDNMDAYGVEYDRNGVRRNAFATKEIIISAGINSPKILMLSGIGPKEHLESLDIPVKKDLPVGKNLQDHTCTFLGPFFINESLTIRGEDINLSAITTYLTSGSGILSTALASAMGFVSSSQAKQAGETDWPDIHLIFAGISIYAKYSEDISRTFNWNTSIIEPYYRHALGRNGFMQLTVNSRPHSRGEITLKSTDPYSTLNIDPKYLDNDHDVQVMIESVKKGVELIENTTTFQRIGGQFTTERFPGCEGVEFRSDAYWECYVRQTTTSMHHIVGTCSMGREDSPHAVVDPQLRVIGTKRLRVIDASVMPVVVVGNTNAPSMMIGEKGAAMIEKDWQLQGVQNSHSDKIDEMG